jgi:SMP-30/Gluconolactonase/LRE-like region
MWQSQAQQLLWVDIRARPPSTTFTPTTGGVGRRPMPEPIGLILPADDGSMIAGLKCGLARVVQDGGRIALLPSDGPAGTGPHQRIPEGRGYPDCIAVDSQKPCVGYPVGRRSHPLRSGVARDFRHYAPLVRSGGTVLFDGYDTPEWPAIQPHVPDERARTARSESHVIGRG